MHHIQKQVRIVIVGMGAMGKGLFYQCSISPAFSCLVICDIKIERAIDCANWLKVNYRIVETETQLNEAVANGVLAICQDGMLAASCEKANVFIESSNSIIPAAQYSITAIRQGMHLILMNAEIDLIFGPYLLELATQHGVVYSSCDGDQHGVIRHLVNDMEYWGFDLVMTGNMKGFLDRYSNPEKIIPEADKRNLDYKMATAYTDGTKLNIEMALLCNALNLKTICPGMKGPEISHVKKVFEVFDFDKIWSEGQPVADYILKSQPDGGVFAIGRSDNPYQKEMMKYYKMGDGPYYLFYRPYHLCHVEAMAEIEKSVKKGKGFLKPDFGFQANVFAYAKKDMTKGEKLDGLGGFPHYGMLENYTREGSHPGIPVCLAEDVVLSRDLKKDEGILMCDIETPAQRLDFHLYEESIRASQNTIRDVVENVK